jgi:hypothetical protein
MILGFPSDVATQNIGVNRNNWKGVTITLHFLLTATPLFAGE